MIFLAVEGPTPGSRSSVEADAVLGFTLRTGRAFGFFCRLGGGFGRGLLAATFSTGFAVSAVRPCKHGV